jgi:hypothetical protein
MPNDDLMNNIIRNTRSAPRFDLSTTSNAEVNRMLRQAAGYDTPEPTPKPQEPPQLPKLGGSDYGLKDEEPPPGVNEDEWERWVYKGRVIRLLDQAGRLPGEPGYDRATTGPGGPDSYDLAAAVKARRDRWRNLTGI